MKISSAEATKLSASTAIAIGAVKRAMTPPPNGWPRIMAADWLIWSFELPSTSSSRSRTVGR